MMDTLQPLVCGYLSAMGYKILDRRPGCVVADRLVYGEHRDTHVVWTVPDGIDGTIFEGQLRPDIRRTYPQYPEARGYVISPSRSGFSRDFTEELGDRRIRLLVPVQFFDTPFKSEESTEATKSAISELRSGEHLKGRVPQPFSRAGVSEKAEGGADLLETLYARLHQRPKGSNVYIVVGQAGIGKTYLFRSLFTRLYDEFDRAKKAQRLFPRPIPLVPEHIRRLPALRTELLLESFLRTDVASPISREGFQWLLLNGFATWLLDGLDELYASDPNFFFDILDLVTQKDSRAQILLTCRDSLLAAPEAFQDIEVLGSGGDILQVYQLSAWQTPSKRLYAWVRECGRLPGDGDKDTPRIQAFVAQVNESEALRSLSGIPFYCGVLFDLFEGGELREFGSDADLLEYVIERMIDREIGKGLLHTDMFQGNGLQEWLEQMAAMFVESSYTDISRGEAEEFARLVLVGTMDSDTQNRVVTNLLQFPLFRAGSERGLIAFAHELLAQLLAAKWFRARLLRRPAEIGARLARRPDLERATLTRFIAHGLSGDDEKSVRAALRTGEVPDDAFSSLLSILILARPEMDLLKRLGANWEARNLQRVRFERRDLSGVSFRNSDLTDAVFLECNLADARFEGSLLHRTRFDRSRLNNAEFGDASRIQSVVVEGRHIESMEEIREWLTRDAARVVLVEDPCPTARQVRHVLGKFVDALGRARRDQLDERGLMAGKRFPGAANTDECVHALVTHGYLVGPDFRQRYRRAEGDKYAEIVAFVRDGRIGDSLGRLIAGLCRRQSCLHRVH